MEDTLTTTYAEAQGKAPFDWNAFLAQPTHDDEEWHIATSLAGNWITCACGNQCDALERDFDGSPKDYLLLELGERFCRVIVGRKVLEARQTLALIEQRTTLLLTTQAALDGKETGNA